MHNQPMSDAELARTILVGLGYIAAAIWIMALLLFAIGAFR
jgi:hypothetical protein